MNRVYLLGSGTSNNVFNGSFATSHLRRFIRKLEGEMGFMTANDATVTKHGVRAQIAAWDRMSDYVLMKSPDLISWGERVMLGGFNSVWLAGKLPCFISHCSRYIIIFDLEGVLPFWSPCHEESSEFVGTFEFWHNRFRDRCGVYIDDW